MKHIGMRVPWWKTQLGEEEAGAVRDAVLDGRLSQGELTEELERRLSEALGVRYVTLTTSGSVALAIALIAANVSAGDEVIVPNRTYIATAHAAQLVGATVRLVDTLPQTPLIDPTEVERKITPRTKAIMPVHLNGRACDMDALVKIADRHGVVIVEDAAQALFSKRRGQYLGTFGLFGCFSLGVTKLITSGQGGFIVTRDAEAHQRIQRMRFHGVAAPREGSYDHFGYNFRYTDVQAAIALKQLDRLETKIDAHRNLYRRYQETMAGFSKVKLIDVDIEGEELPLWIEVICDDLDALIGHLDSRGIESLSMTPNLSVSPHLRDDAEFANAAYFERTGLTLPSGPDQNPKAIQTTLDALVEFENASTFRRKQTPVQ